MEVAECKDFLGAGHALLLNEPTVMIEQIPLSHKPGCTCFMGALCVYSVSTDTKRKKDYKNMIFENSQELRETPAESREVCACTHL